MISLLFIKKWFHTILYHFNDNFSRIQIFLLRYKLTKWDTIVVSADRLQEFGVFCNGYNWVLILYNVVILKHVI